MDGAGKAGERYVLKSLKEMSERERGGREKEVVCVLGNMYKW